MSSIFTMPTFPTLDPARRLARLDPPAQRPRAVLDTDTYNEIDDQFAIVQALLSPEALDVEAIYAAPFHNEKSSGPGDGMEKSYDEILRLLERLDRTPDGFVYRGSTAWLADAETAQPSDAASDLVARGMSGDVDDAPLYVVAIGAITNVTSALLMEPELVKRIVVVWLGGHALYWPHAREFNLKQDVLAAQILFDCGVPLIHVPCMGVVSHLTTTVPEVERYVDGRGAIGTYLADIFRGHEDDSTVDDSTGEKMAWAKQIWDMAAVAWLLNPAWLPTDLVPSPILTDNMTWSVDRSRHLIRSARWVNRNAIFRNFFEKLASV